MYVLPKVMMVLKYMYDSTMNEYANRRLSKFESRQLSMIPPNYIRVVLSGPGGRETTKAPPYSLLRNLLNLPLIVVCILV